MLSIESAVVPENWFSPDALHDIGVITLAEDAPAAAPRYSLDGGQDEIGSPVVVAGYGWTGHGSVGMEVPDMGLLAGLNRHEVDSGEFSFDEVPPNLLMHDFDSGLEENNALAWLGIPSDLGFGDDELAAARGDSGGPVFLEMAIAGAMETGTRMGMTSSSGRASSAQATTRRARRCRSRRRCCSRSWGAERRSVL